MCDIYWGKNYSSHLETFKYGAQFTKINFALFEGVCNDHIFDTDLLPKNIPEISKALKDSPMN